MSAGESLFDDREIRNRHLTALAGSLFLHVILFTVVVLQNRTQFLQRLAVVKPQSLAALQRKAPPAQPETPDVPLVFVEVDLSDPVPPKETPFYSDKSSRAANPQAEKETALPKIEGTQDKVVRTTEKTVTIKPPEPVAPPPPVEKPPEVTKPVEEKPAAPPTTTGLAPGPLALNKPQPDPKPNPAQEAAKPVVRVRPRTLKEAIQQNPGLAGEKMKQAGGVRRSQLQATFDVRETSFGAYDRKFIEAVQQRWYDLLETGTFTRDRTGKVSIAFRLNMDGRITNMQLLDEDVGPLLAIVCQRAVLDPQPYGAWPSEMKKAISKTYREVTFTFYYQ